ILELLNNSDPNSFNFSEGLHWMDFSLSATEVERARNAAHFSIGSCSLHEPDADLKRLFPSMC
ncbi:MAG: hypothetical protein KDD53_01575, partial [Bdellovibrionales bacterium]|nr:hypothetical protein [Bdellovibrionales bacterium]